MIVHKCDGSKDHELSLLYNKVANFQIPRSGPRTNRLLLMREYGYDVQSFINKWHRFDWNSYIASFDKP